MLGPRDGRLSWEDYHMLQAVIASWRSPDPNTQVGAVIVDKENRTLGTGYNGFPRGISRNRFPWDRNKTDPLENKYAYVVHAEKNAIINCSVPIDEATCYVTLHPCNECAKDIIQVGINKVVYLENPYVNLWSSKAAEDLFLHLDIEVVRHKWKDSLAADYVEKLWKNLK